MVKTKHSSTQQLLCRVAWNCEHAIEMNNYGRKSILMLNLHLFTFFWVA